MELSNKIGILSTKNLRGYKNGTGVYASQNE